MIDKTALTQLLQSVMKEGEVSLDFLESVGDPASVQLLGAKINALQSIVMGNASDDDKSKYVQLVSDNWESSQNVAFDGTCKLLSRADVVKSIAGLSEEDTISEEEMQETIDVVVSELKKVRDIANAEVVPYVLEMIKKIKIDGIQCSLKFTY